MCGIFGVVSNQTIRVDKALTALKMLKHRGPDNEGFILKDNVFLGHNRLSILDLSENGNQPMSDHEKKIIISVNGEIYNFLSLKEELADKYKFISSSDSEVILHGYKEWGIERLLQKLNGMFAFSIYDIEKKKVILVRDRVGIKPLFYSYINDIFCYASELKAIVNYLDKSNLEIDNTALYDFLTYLYIPTPKTLYKNVFKLPPAHYLEYNLNTKKYSINKYWKLSTEVDNNITFKEAREQLIFLLKKSISQQIVSDVPVGFFLSGGIDSSTVVALASKISGQINTFSIGFDSSERDETPFGKIIADLYKTNHIKKIVSLEDIIHLKEKIKTWYDEPFADTSCYPTFLVSSLAKKKSTVVLTGDGGDELFSGYNWYNLFNKYTSLKLNKLIKMKSISLENRYLNYFINKFENYYLGDLELYSKLLSGESLKVKKQFKKLLEIDIVYDDYWFFRKFYKRNLSTFKRLQYLDFHTYLPEDILTKVDRTSMAVSLECRVPFLSNELIDFSFSLPEEIILHNNTSKGLLKDAMTEFLPQEILYRNKQGFSIPLKKWRKEITKNRSRQVEILDMFGIKLPNN